MTASARLLVLGLGCVLGDHHHGYEAAYVYPDAYTNSSALSHHAGSGRTR